MAKRRDDALLDALGRRNQPSADDVRKGLAHANWVLVDAAAKAAVDLPASEVATPLADALQRLLGPVDDPGGDAILAVLDAMRKHQINERSLYRVALFYERIQRSFGEGIDVGATVRASACMAVVESGDPSAAVLITPVLFEQQTARNTQDNPAARIAAARGLGAVGDDAAAGALRLKLSTRQHPDAAEVLGECVASLARLAGDNAIQPIAEALQRLGGAVASAAVVPVGELRSRPAIVVMRLLRDVLRTEAVEADAMIGFALLRDAEATDELFDALINRPADVQTAAAKALHLLARDPSVCDRFDRVVTDLPNATTLRRHFANG